MWNKVTYPFPNFSCTVSWKFGNDAAQTLQKLLGFYQIKEGFWPDFTDSNMIIYQNFTGPTQFLSANVRGPVSFTVSASSTLLGMWLLINAGIKVIIYVEKGAPVLYSSVAVTCFAIQFGWYYLDFRSKHFSLFRNLECHSTSLR